MKVKIIPFKTKVEGIFAELPEDVLIENIWMNEFYPHFLQFYLTGETFYDRVRLIDFDDAHYEPVNFARDITDAEARNIVEKSVNHVDYWKNYSKSFILTYGLYTPLDSFNTLTQSLNIDESKHWLVLIKKYNS